MKPKPDPVTETIDLVRGAQAGDRAALDRLCARYYPLVHKVVRLRMGERLRRRRDSVDVLQETFAKAVQRFDRFEMRTEGSLINWLAKLAENTIREIADYDEAQKRNVGAEVPLVAPGRTTGAAGPADLVPALMPVPLDAAIRGEEAVILEACLEELPAHYRDIILLRNYLGLTFAEVMAETGRPSEGAARMLHAKAMRELVKLVRARTGERRGSGG